MSLSDLSVILSLNSRLAVLQPRPAVSTSQSTVSFTSLPKLDLNSRIYLHRGKKMRKRGVAKRTKVSKRTTLREKRRMKIRYRK